MSGKWRRLAALLMVLGMVTQAAWVQARDLDQDEALQLRREGVILPLEQLLQSAMQRYPGARLLEAELEEDDDVLIYEVELLTTDSVVRELELDARSGELLKDELED